LLSVAVMSGGQEHYYLDLAREDYFLDGGEPPGLWYGRAAADLGISDAKVERDALTRTMNGRSPDGHTTLVQLQHYQDGRERQPGWDLTFSAPKSVSVLWSQADPELRHTLEGIHRDAVRDAIDYLQDSAAWTRRGKAGELPERVALMFATFEHGTSRAQEPQLHTHAITPNAGRRDDGTWGTIRSRDLYQHKMAAGAIYRTSLAHRCAQLDLAIERGRHAFRLQGVPKSLEEEFSTRRSEIDAVLAEAGVSGPRASELAAKHTRAPKEHVSRDQLFEAWAAVGRAHAFSTPQAHSLLGARHLARSGPAESKLIEKSCLTAVEALAERRSNFHRRDLVALVASDLEAQAISPASLLRNIDAFIAASRELVQLPEKHGYDRFATRALFESEKRILDAAELARHDNRHALVESDLHDVLARRSTLSEEQRNALRHLTIGGGALACVSGFAGTGKTFLLDAAREAWERRGFKVIGATLSATAALELQDGSKIDSATVAKLLLELDRGIGDALGHVASQLGRAVIKKRTFGYDKAWRPDSNTILVLDEAAMISTPEIERLIAAVRKRGGKVVLVGDERQLQAIGAGGAFAALKQHLGAAELVDIRRQNEDWMRDATRQFAEGDARGALAQYALGGCVQIERDKQAAMLAVINSWLADRTNNLSESLVLAGTRQEVAALNDGIQAARLARNELKEDTIARLGDALYFVGDRVTFTHNMRRLGFLNGDFGAIETISRKGLLGPFQLTIRLDRERVDDGIPVPIRVTVPLTKDTPIALGYASTVHKAQGATVDRTFVLAGGWMQDAELSYVQMSRHRELCRIFTTESEAGEDLDELVRSMEVSHRKDLAHDLQTLQRRGHSLQP